MLGAVFVGLQTFALVVVQLVLSQERLALLFV